MNKLLDELQKQLEDAYTDMENYYAKYMEAETRARKIQDEIEKINPEELFEGGDK